MIGCKHVASSLEHKNLKNVFRYLVLSKISAWFEPLYICILGFQLFTRPKDGEKKVPSNLPYMCLVADVRAIEQELSLEGDSRY